MTAAHELAVTLEAVPPRVVVPLRPLTSAVIVGELEQRIAGLDARDVDLVPAEYFARARVRLEIHCELQALVDWIKDRIGERP